MMCRDFISTAKSSSMGKIRHELWIFSKAQFSAQLATITDYAISLLMAELFYYWYIIATFFGALSGGIVNCIINYKWVFDDDCQKKETIVMKYFLVWTGSMLLNTTGTYVLTEMTCFHFILPKIAVSVCVALLWNYQLQRLFVYRNIHMRK